jgi:hypothetical protein
MRIPLNKLVRGSHPPHVNIGSSRFLFSVITSKVPLKAVVTGCLLVIKKKHGSLEPGMVCTVPGSLNWHMKGSTRLLDSARFKGTRTGVN